MLELLYILAGPSNLPIKSTQQMATRFIPVSNPASNHIITLSIIYNSSLFIKRVLFILLAFKTLYNMT